MTAGTTSYGDIGQRTAVYAMAVMLNHAEPVLVIQKFGMVKELPKNKSETVKFRRPIPFTAATTPLQEGVTPTPQRMGYEDVPASLKQYGAITEITDKVADLSEDPVLRDASMLSGEQAAETMEKLAWGVIKAGTNVYYANGVARASVNTVISRGKQRAVTRGLKAQKAKMVSTMLSSSTNYGTKAVEAAYIALTHTDVESDVRDLAGFKQTADYGSRSTLCPEELGSCESVRYVVSQTLTSFASAGGTAGSMVSTNTTNADVYPVVIIGKEAFGNVALKGMGSIVPMILNPGTPSKSDPLGQRGYCSWKTWFCCVILNENWMARLEVAATAL